MFKVKKVKTPERRQWRPSGVLIVNFEQILHFLLFLFLNLNRQIFAVDDANLYAIVNRKFFHGQTSIKFLNAVIIWLFYKKFTLV